MATAISKAGQNFLILFPQFHFGNVCENRESIKKIFTQIYGILQNGECNEKKRFVSNFDSFTSEEFRILALPISRYFNATAPKTSAMQ